MTSDRLLTRSSAAFSLIELCLLLTVVGVLGIFAVPMLSSTMRSMQLSAETRKIATSLSSAKLNAITQMNPYRISFDADANSWRLQKYDRTTTTFQTQQAENTLSDGLANSGIMLKSSSGHELTGYPSESSASVTFNVRGFPVDSTGAPTANNVIYVSDSDCDYAITVSLTGKVQVLKYRSSQWVSQ